MNSGEIRENVLHIRFYSISQQTCKLNRSRSQSNLQYKITNDRARPAPWNLHTFIGVSIIISNLIRKDTQRFISDLLSWNKKSCVFYYTIFASKGFEVAELTFYIFELNFESYILYLVVQEYIKARLYLKWHAP